MIKANELRLGNILTDGVISPFIVTEITELGVKGNYIQKELPDHENKYAFLYDNIDGIPLTEEWLITFGVTPTGNLYSIKNFTLQYQQTCLYIGNEDRLNTLRIEKSILKYVHQLQNIYFALTGEELIIK